ncbi:GH-E family nuclease [Lachnobacterium bovis]|uniref:HNH/ENDO VII superfamily nuclease with conserved GHE residues n=1 Tax=Lachnobacterium bovis TaxID=140626 RepID=A0A1H9PCW5_9FIRM|nr:GH-E family nuclease [Lachnobacterium bovis]SER45413.1 HNH/ENDO VII superfamily nuclease with conserved GHE residues [Lachnobacterium bovis]
MPGNNIIIDRNALIADCKSIINRFEEEQENFNKIIKSFENFNNADKLKSDAYKNLSNHLKDYNLLLKSLVNANLLDVKCCEEIITKLNSLADGAPSKLDYDKMGDKLKSLKKERDSLEEKRNKEIKEHESMEMVSPIYITQSKFMDVTQNPLTDGYKYQIGSIDEQMKLLKERRKFCEEVSKVEGVFDSNNNLRKTIIFSFEEMQKSFKDGKYNYVLSKIFIRDLKKYNTVVEKNYSGGIIKESTQADINCWIKVDYKMSDSDRKKAQKIVDKYQAKFKKKYNVLPEQSAHGVNIVRTLIWAKMSYEEKLEYEYCMALKQKLSMNNKAYAACYGLINSIPFLPEMNNLTYSLLMGKKDPKVYADSPEGRLKNADIQSDGWCTKGEVIGDIAQFVAPFAWAKLSKAGECVKVVKVASEGEKSVALAEEGIGAASKVEKTAKVTSKLEKTAEVTSKAGKITKGASKVDKAAEVTSKAGKITEGGSGTKHYLHRPYIRKGTIDGVNANTKVNYKTGLIYDSISGKWVDPANVELGHRQGYEFWRMRDWAEAHGMTQAEFNDFMNNSDFYAWQDITSNRSHAFEQH